MINENRIDDIEIKIARQEDLVETLNQLVYEQQQKISELEALCGALARRIAEVSGAATPSNDRPPHY